MTNTDCIAAPYAGEPTPSGEIRIALGGTERRGLWSVPRHLRVRVLLGTAHLDLREARLAAGTTTIDVAVTLGSLTVIVPTAMSVAVEVAAHAASVETFGDSTEASTTPFRDLERPQLRIIGDATLGSCEIVRRDA